MFLLLQKMRQSKPNNINSQFEIFCMSESNRICLNHNKRLSQQQQTGFINIYLCPGNITRTITDEW